MTHQRLQSLRLSSLALTGGSLLILILWPIYISEHGPTSFERNQLVFGQRTLFWGSLLGGLPNLMLAAGLVGLRSVVLAGIRSWARVGFGLTLLGLLVPAVVDLLTSSLGPPWFVPIVGIGSVLLAAAKWRDPLWRGRAAYLLLSLGILQAVAIAWFFMPKDVFDSINGYRLYGLMAHVLVGIGWMLLGVHFFRNLKGESISAA